MADPSKTKGMRERAAPRGTIVEEKEPAGATPADAQIAFEEVVGERGMYLARLGAVTLRMSTRFNDGVPRVRDLDLSAWLGYDRAENVRTMIVRLIQRKKLNDSEVFFTLKQTSETGGRPSKEFWLTRKQALLVASQSGTDRAWAITTMMVDVFDAFLDRFVRGAPAGLTEADVLRIVTPQLESIAQRAADITADRVVLLVMPAQRSLPGLDNEAGATILRLTGRIEKLEQDVASGVIDAAVAKDLRARLRSAAQIKARATGCKSSGVLRGWMNRIEKRIGFGGENSEWENLPRRLLGDVVRLISGFEKEAARSAVEAAKRQAANDAGAQASLKTG